MSSPLAPEDFPEYLREVHGDEPIPWQVRLCATVLGTGWPRVLDLPADAGGAVALDVAVFALAASTSTGSRRHPLRIVYLVERGSSAAAAKERAQRIAAALRAAPAGSVRERVARGLAGAKWTELAEPHEPLRASTLLASVPGSDLWIDRPDQAAILVSTVDAVGSRLLFRGHGVSESMRPVHAGLLGHDVLHLLDESVPAAFAETLEAIADRYAGWAERPLPRCFGVVRLGAADPAPSRRAPVLLPAHLDGWAHTSAPLPEPDAEVGPWLHGADPDSAPVQVVWRCDLPDLAAWDSERRDGEHADRTMVLSLRPRSAEARTVPFSAALAWLRAGASRPFLRWTGEETVTLLAAESLRAGDTIVVPADYGGVSDERFDPRAKDRVDDLAEIAALEQSGRACLRIHAAVLARLWEDGPPGEHDPPLGLAADLEEVHDHELRDRMLDWLRSTRTPTESRWIPAWEALRTGVGVVLERSEEPRSAPSGLKVRGLLLRSRQRLETADGELATDSASTDSDRRSLRADAVPLAEHQEGVAAWAVRFATAVGLSAELRGVLEAVGRFHDLGKADPRHQRFLHGGCEFRHGNAEVELASAAVDLRSARARERALRRSGLPPGSRHELLSVALLEQVPLPARPEVADFDLLLHLVGSHHGSCRPFAAFAADPEPVEVCARIGAVELRTSSDHRLAALDSGVSERFARLVRRYGWWGLAFLEALLRLADHQRSLVEERG